MVSARSLPESIRAAREGRFPRRGPTLGGDAKSGEVHDAVDARERGGVELAVRRVPEGRAVAGGAPVAYEPQDLDARLGKRRREGAADETARTGDRDFHAAYLIRYPPSTLIDWA